MAPCPSAQLLLMPHYDQNSHKASGGEPSELVLDGVRYACLESCGKTWRLGSLSPHWREELPLLGRDPDSAKLLGLAEKDIYLHSGERPRLAVACCGLGSAWPGMGRELYDNFPAARKAMDALASYADWDLLSLMDETDPEVLNHSRTQIPYLFMLEYAQWSQLISLGLKPDLICGHSLGELVALCLAGVYSPEAAWLLFETRAAHMASLEENPASETGMLAISGDCGLVQEILHEYPDLGISNRNTERQHILGGPRSQLLEVRKKLRRKRIPAFMLGINLAFHNPAMRILRDLSLRRLNGLNMRPPQIPLLSCVTATPYPGEQAAICKWIADLDENTVDWPKSVNAMSSQYGISHFLELGPQETLCGLVSEIHPQAQCFSASRKGQEAMAMRQLCARLYAYGLLDGKLAQNQARLRAIFPPSSPIMPAPAPGAEGQSLSWQKSAEWDIVIQLLAEETGRPRNELRPDLDLRYDLALRSSRFPYLVQEAERRFKRAIPLERLPQISTVGDLANFLSGNQSVAPENQRQSFLPLSERPSPFTLPPLAAFTFSGTDKSLRAWRPDPFAPGFIRKLAGPVALLILDAALLPQIWSGMAPFRLPLLVPETLLPECVILGENGAMLHALTGISPSSSATEIVRALSEASAKLGPLQGVLLALPPLKDVVPLNPGTTEELLSLLPRLKSLCKPDGWLCCLERLEAGGAEESSPETALDTGKAFFSMCRQAFPDADFPMRTIFWHDQRARPDLQNRIEAGDMLARALLMDSPREILWLPARLDKSLDQSPSYCPSSSFTDYTRQSPGADHETRLGRFTGECQFSSYAEPGLASHGELAGTDSDGGGKAPWLPVGHILKTIISAARLATPWLVPFSLSDVRLGSFPLLHPGLVRECRLEAIAGQWLVQEKELTRLCGTSMEVRGLSPNGRRSGQWEPVCSALCVLAPSTDKLAEYHRLDQPPGPRQALEPSCLATFYDLLKFGDEWRSLKTFSMRKEGSGKDKPIFYSASIQKMPLWIAGTSECGYNGFGYIMEAVFQALTLALVLPSGGDPCCGSLLDSKIRKWKCRYIGLVRFVDRLENCAAPLGISFKRSWEDARYTRFDGMVHDNAGKPLLSFLHFEFDEIVPPETAP